KPVIALLVIRPMRQDRVERHQAEDRQKQGQRRLLAATPGDQDKTDGKAHQDQPGEDWQSELVRIGECPPSQAEELAGTNAGRFTKKSSCGEIAEREQRQGHCHSTAGQTPKSKGPVMTYAVGGNQRQTVPNQ